MYIPRLFEVKDFESQADLIKNNPLGVIVSCNQSFFGNSDIKATHVPFYLRDGENKSLVAHLAAENDQIEQLEKAKEVLVVFLSVDSYISPAWYPNKKKSHKSVPTWNFAAVHVYGHPKIYREKEDKLKMVSTLTEQEEGKRPEGEEFVEKWKVSDAPESYINLMLENIVGLEIEISQIQSKWKFDQNKVPVDVKGEIEGLENEVGGEKGSEMAQITRERYPKPIPK